jgi:hypothetical protein
MQIARKHRLRRLLRESCYYSARGSGKQPFLSIPSPEFRANNVPGENNRVFHSGWSANMPGNCRSERSLIFADIVDNSFIQADIGHVHSPGRCIGYRPVFDISMIRKKPIIGVPTVGGKAG